MARSKSPTNAAEPSQAELAGRPDLGLIRQLWRFRAYGREELRPLLLGVGMRFLELLADLATPWPLALVIDSAITQKPPDGVVGQIATIFGPSQLGMLTVAAIAVLAITGMSGVFDYLGDRIMNSAGERITSTIRSEVFAHIQRLPMVFHDRQAVGELTSRVATDTARIEDGMVGIFSTLIPGVLSLIGYSVVLLGVDWRLGLVALCSAPLLFFTAARYTRLIRTSARRRRAAEGRMSGFVTESLQGIRTVQAFGRQELHDERFGADNDKVLATGLRAVELRARFTPLLQFVASLGTAALLFVGGYGVIHTWWTVGVLVVVTAYLRDLLKPMKALSKLALTFTQGAVAAERIAAVLDQERLNTDTEHALPARVTGEIRLERVTLDYGRGPVLDGLQLVIDPGDRVALLGHNGAGKSTVLALISGLYPPTGGQVLLDGLSVSEVPDRWRHRQVAVVLQDTFLFSGTIRENVRYGRPDATDDEVTHAATAALVTEFTDDLPDGLDTVLADGGIGLSGGQRQRVGIARALLTDAPIVLLDEPTTGLDAGAEDLVVRALATLVEGRTVVMTTHRPAVTRLANRTVHLSGGAISQEPVDRSPTAPAAARPARRIGYFETAAPTPVGSTGAMPSEYGAWWNDATSPVDIYGGRGRGGAQHPNDAVRSGRGAGPRTGAARNGHTRPVAATGAHRLHGDDE